MNESEVYYVVHTADGRCDVHEFQTESDVVAYLKRVEEILCGTGPDDEPYYVEITDYDTVLPDDTYPARLLTRAQFRDKINAVDKLVGYLNELNALEGDHDGDDVWWVRHLSDPEDWLTDMRRLRIMSTDEYLGVLKARADATVELLTQGREREKREERTIAKAWRSLTRGSLLTPRT
jgi:hypothetical protein